MSNIHSTHSIIGTFFFFVYSCIFHGGIAWWLCISFIVWRLCVVVLLGVVCGCIVCGVCHTLLMYSCGDKLKVGRSSV